MLRCNKGLHDTLSCNACCHKNYYSYVCVGVWLRTTSARSSSRGRRKAPSRRRCGRAATRCAAVRRPAVAPRRWRRCWPWNLAPRLPSSATTAGWRGTSPPTAQRRSGTKAAAAAPRQALAASGVASPATWPVTALECEQQRRCKRWTCCRMRFAGSGTSPFTYSDEVCLTKSTTAQIRQT